MYKRFKLWNDSLAKFLNEKNLLWLGFTFKQEFPEKILNEKNNAVKFYPDIGGAKKSVAYHRKKFSISTNLSNFAFKWT